MLKLSSYNGVSGDDNTGRDQIPGYMSRQAYLGEEGWKFLKGVTVQTQTDCDLLAKADMRVILRPPLSSGEEFGHESWDQFIMSKVEMGASLRAKFYGFAPESSWP